jgi:hypothetical protein
VFLGLLVAFSQNLPLVPSIIYHLLLTPHNSTPRNVLETQIISYILRICQYPKIHTGYSDQKLSVLLNVCLPFTFVLSFFLLKYPEHFSFIPK